MREFYKLVEIMKKLRGPEGCPWDKEQDLESLKPYLLEEAYEVLEVMDVGGELLKSELGDLLLQIVFQSNICEEKGEFDIDDVIRGLCEKLIRRHPHVFREDIKVSTSEEVMVNWEKIKKEESEHRDRKSILDGIPKYMPALMKAEKIQKKVAKVGFQWEDINGVLDKVEEEIKEFREALMDNNKKEMQEELGDIFFSLVNLARYLDINSQEALNKTIKKFESRFRYVEENCDIDSSSLEEMDSLWQEAKKNVKQ